MQPPQQTSRFGGVITMVKYYAMCRDENFSTPSLNQHAKVFNQKIRHSTGMNEHKSSEKPPPMTPIKRSGDELEEYEWTFQVHTKVKANPPVVENIPSTTSANPPKFNNSIEMVMPPTPVQPTVDQSVDISSSDAGSCDESAWEQSEEVDATPMRHSIGSLVVDHSPIVEHDINLASRQQEFTRQSNRFFSQYNLHKLVVAHREEYLSAQSSTSIDALCHKILRLYIEATGRIKNCPMITIEEVRKAFEGQGIDKPSSEFNFFTMLGQFFKD